MALTINDRVKETSTTTGTGALTFAGAVSGFETFSAGIGNSNTTYYAVVNTDTPTEWEVGLGTLAGDSSTITRTTVISSSNSDSAVSFGAGTKEIFCTLPASKAVIKDASGNVTPSGVITGTTVEATGDTAASDNAAMGYTAAEGLILTGQGSTNDVTIKNDADGTVISIPTGTTGVTFAGTVGSGAITSTGVVTGTGFTIGSAVINEAELETIDGVTAGTVAASKAVVVDANKDIGTFRNITIDGTFSDGNYTFDTSGNVSGLGTIGSGAITSTGTVQGTTITATTAFAGTLSTAAQTNITSLGTLTALTVDDIALNGKVITMTGSTSDTAVITVGTNGTLSIVTTDDGAAAANIQITGDGTVDIDSAGVLTLDSGAAINIEPASGSAILLDGTISVDAGVVTGATSITSTAFVGALTGNVTGNASGTAATVTTAAQSNITSLGTLTTLTVDSIILNGTTIGHTSDTDLITLADGLATVAGEVSMTTLDIGGTNVTSTAAELNILDGVTSTAAEINLLDGLDRGSILYGNASSATTVLGQGSADQVLTSDGTDIAWADGGGTETTAGAVGTYCQVYYDIGSNATYTLGTDISGGSFAGPAGHLSAGAGSSSASGAQGMVETSGSLSGTWRLMGFMKRQNTGQPPYYEKQWGFSIALRIS